VNRERPDVLLVSPGTTEGWRRADSELADVLRELGVSVSVVGSEMRIARHFRRTMQLTDLAEAAAMRWALSRALRHTSPRAILFSTTQSTMLQPALRLRGAAVRFDALAAVNRPGRANALQHHLEQRALARAKILLPWGLDPALRVPGDPTARAVALPVSIAMPQPSPNREPIAVTYAGNPDKKGLELVVQAWREASPVGRSLIVTGISAVAGRAYLRARGVTEPERVEWAGMLPQAEHRALVARAELYVSASRIEEYGVAQLEALAGGALLVTTPSQGPYEALPLARRLEPGIVAAERSAAALAAALQVALQLPEPARSEYRQRARALVAPYSREELRRRLERDVLPALLPAVATSVRSLG
jgi:glycosyltransferase involved in cell wall biosynthesis